MYAFMVCIRKDFWVEGRKKLVEHCHSDMHELESTIQEFSGGGGGGEGGGFQGHPLCMNPVH